MTLHSQTGLTSVLRQYTHAAHERLDHRMTGLDLFSSHERYTVFLVVQYLFHRDVSDLYARADVAALVPDMDSRNRLELVERDMQDLCVPYPMVRRNPPVAGSVSAAIGWLYVAEGSKLGANILAKRAQDMGLTESFGARHLAPDAQGRAYGWQSFKAAVDHAPLDTAICISHAEAAFERVTQYLDRCEPYLQAA
ncbi:biliverdin-producing heme oxygenase [Acetobacter tropicalis]|uniref:Heme oxygenase n=1 Tax=Acetobacter tropicalis NBRC 101654 TaxID=749388 RepID=F7VEI3_9PROT|nr:MULTISPECIES: biliverdin-producing heme oxygenase [Acetobacter]MCG4255367.1 biliverdin-producing heme oxygenase [Acetobacter senegalensis]GAA08778.1 heme oxygenase [Acetobacter tropicalis NBRC 101654]